jgi:hypothetical protein
MRQRLLASCLTMTLGGGCYAHTGSRRTQETTAIVVTGIVLVGVIIAVASNHNEPAIVPAPDPMPGRP